MLPSNSRQNQDYSDVLKSLRPNVLFIVIIFGALIAFEIFNYTTTDHALGDLLGNLTFAGLPWSTILALAFCGIDFAGIARLFTPETGMNEPKEVWYLFGAWLLAATMNAILTWWGVSMAVASHPIQSKSVVNPETITGAVPVFVAIMVWVIRILIIGTLSLALDRVLHPEAAQQRTPLQSMVGSRNQAQNLVGPTIKVPAPASYGSQPPTQRPMPRAAASTNPRPGRYSMASEEADSAVEPTYHSLGGSRPANNGNTNTGNNRFR